MLVYFWIVHLHRCLNVCAGVAPTAVQAAAMQGQQVVMGQKEGGVLSGSGSGGYTFW